MNVTDHGHCDILDDIFWDGCHLIHFCKTVAGTDLALYHNFVQGLMSAFVMT